MSSELIMDFHHTKVKLVNEYKLDAGAVGGVGDPNTNIRMRRSSSTMAPIFIGRLGRGSNIIDGDNPMAFRNAGHAMVHDDNNTRRIHYAQNVTTIVDKVASERYFTPKIVCGTPRLSWQMQRNDANPRINQGFVTLPGGYGPRPGDLRRGPLPTRTVVEPY